MTETALTLPQRIAAAASDKKARDIVILNLTGISTVADEFIICSAASSTQVKAIADHIEDKLVEQGYAPLRKEGGREGRWILLDYGDTVAHVFVEEERAFYNLERLWGDAPSENYDA
jgi:ribosome-associated protein